MITPGLVFSMNEIFGRPDNNGFLKILIYLNKNVFLPTEQEFLGVPTEEGLIKDMYLSVFPGSQNSWAT